MAHPAKGEAMTFGISNEQRIGIRPEVHTDAAALLMANQAGPKLVSLVTATIALPFASASHVSQRARGSDELGLPRR
jgi:hypothetical protein